MAFLGKTLTVYLGADTSKLRAGLNSADRSLSGFGSKLNNMIGPALLGAAAAAGAFAVAIGVDAVQAAMDEEKELAKLNTTLENLGFTAASEQINTFIDDMQFATGVTDSELRPAYERLLIATGSVAESQKLLNIAVDTSYGVQKNVATVANALGKAYEGNFGALGKLNGGIDASIIKNKDLTGAVQTLADVHGGQAQANADTLSGKIGILSIAFDELKESLGKGLIDGFTQSGDGITKLTGRMRELQPQTEALGFDIGVLGQNLLEAALGAKTFIDETNKMLQGVLSYGGPVIQAFGNTFLDMLNPVGAAIGKLSDFNKAVNPSGGFNPSRAEDALDRVSKAAAGMGQRFAEVVEEVDPLVDKQTKLSSVVEKMNPRLRAQIDLVKELTGKVSDAGKALEDARNSMNSWISSMSQSILSGINLGAAFDQMDDVNQAGEKIGVSLLEGFQKQIDQAGIFGGYLKQLNSEGGPELRDAVAALGPEAGNQLAKEIIDKGLIKTMQSKLVDVQSMAETTAAEMVPPMLVAGVASAAGYLMTMQAELEESSTLLEEMGRRMGKTLSEAMVAEIRAALAAAGVAQGGATSIMAGAPTPGMDQAQLIAGSPLLNGTAIMQAIQRAISDSDQRLGRTGQVVLQ
jgi:uncharacterized protein YoxC